MARDIYGECVFYDRHADARCIIHRDLGVDALPSACRHFPRKVLHDSRGTQISLTHFCPTAAALLLADHALSIVEALPPLRLESEMEGLDARHALPPLLRPGLLSDAEGYDAWERAAISRFSGPNRGYGACLDDLTAATEVIRQWKPGGRSLRDCVLEAFETERAEAPASVCHVRAIQRVARLTVGSTDADLMPIPHFDNEWQSRVGVNEIDWFDRAMKNYLVARLFGNWVAYQGQGLRSIVEWLRTCAAVVRHFVLRRVIESERPLDRAVFIESVRSADLLLLHVLDSGTFARDVAVVEDSSRA